MVKCSKLNDKTLFKYKNNIIIRINDMKIYK